MNNYEYGFITKCAEYGVDPAVLVKIAQAADAQTATGTNFFDNVSNVVGNMLGRAKNTATEAKNKAIELYKDKNIQNALIGGGVGFLASLLARKLLANRRRRRARQEYHDDYDYDSPIFSPVDLAGAALGGLAGYKYNSIKDVRDKLNSGINVIGKIGDMFGGTPK